MKSLYATVKLQEVTHSKHLISLGVGEIQSKTNVIKTLKDHI